LNLRRLRISLFGRRREGVQYSVVNFSDIDLLNRIDAEYYKPIYLELENKIKDAGKRLSIF